MPAECINIGGEQHKQSLIAIGNSMKSIASICGYCGCGCGIRYSVSDQGAILSVSPMENHPVNKGKLCAKGWTGHHFVDHKDRLTSPLLRGEDGNFNPISWDEAFSLMAGQFSDIKSKHGRGSIVTFSSARCTNEENYLLARLTRTAFDSPHIDHCARL